MHSVLDGIIGDSLTQDLKEAHKNLLNFINGGKAVSPEDDTDSRTFTQTWSKAYLQCQSFQQKRALDPHKFREGILEELCASVGDGSEISKSIVEMELLSRNLNVDRENDTDNRRNVGGCISKLNELLRLESHLKSHPNKRNLVSFENAINLEKTKAILNFRRMIRVCLTLMISQYPLLNETYCSFLGIETSMEFSRYKSTRQQLCTYR